MSRTAVNRNSYVYRKYLKHDSAINYVQILFPCSVCKMPLCKESHCSPYVGRNCTFFDELMQTYENHLQCDGNYVVLKSVIPKNEIENLHPQLRRNQNRKHNQSSTCDSSRKHQLIYVIIIKL